MYGLLLLALNLGASAREIVFPPIAGVQHPFVAYNADESLDISGALYLGLTTYGNLPYVHCLAADDEAVEKYDIAILGAPFDTVGWANPRAVPPTCSSINALHNQEKYTY